MIESVGSLVASRFVSPSALYKMLKALKSLATANDSAVEKEFREQIEQLTLEMARRDPKMWDGVDDDERPNQEDARKAAEEFCDAHDDASGPPKRKLLVNAFFGYFIPKFFREGMSKILWDYAVQLEYPDALYLRRLTEEVQEQLQKGTDESSWTEDGIEWGGAQRPLKPSDLDYEFARRLEHIGLVEIGRYGSRADYVVVTPRRGIVEKLMEFLWNDPAGTGELFARSPAEEDRTK